MGEVDLVAQRTVAFNLDCKSLIPVYLDIFLTR